MSMHMIVAEPAVAWQIGMHMYHLSPVPSGLSGRRPICVNCPSQREYMRPVVAMTALG